MSSTSSTLVQFVTPSPAPDITSATTATAPATSTTGSSSGPPGTPGTSSSLYLYTFLATLVLLLGISSAIVIRSLLLRRRHQAMVEEAIRNGTWIPNPVNAGHGGRRGRRDIGAKPVLWDAWLRGIGFAPKTEVEEGKGKERQSYYEDENKDWSDLMPVSVTYLNPPPQNPANGQNNGRIPPEPSRARSMFPYILPSALVPPPSLTEVSAPPSTPPPAAATADSTPQVPTFRVTMLISMPSATPPRPPTAENDEVPPPIVEFGVIDVPVLSSRANADGDNNTSV